jgi:exodeoxyribonuclease V alpha subunit
VATEQELASRVAEVAAADRLHVVTGPAGVPRNAAVRSLAAAGAAAVADDAELLDVGALAVFFAGCSTDEIVVLAGDPAGLGSPGAGRGFVDIAESGLAKVARVDADAGVTGAALRAFAASIASGEVPHDADPTHEVVVVPAATASEAAHRTAQLVGDSIPRALSIPPGDVQVLAASRAGLDAVAALVLPAGTPAPMLVHDCLGHRFEAVVLVLTPESAGLLTRPLVYSAITGARRHLSIVNAAGRALADAVRQPPVPRRTLLRRLLGGYSSSGSQSTSSSSSSPSSSMSSSSSVVSTGPNGVTSSYAANSTSS